MKKQKRPNVAKLLGTIDDLAFQSAMKDPVSCRMFLHGVLLDLDIQGLIVRTQERIAFNREKKSSVLDVLIKDSRGRGYDIEVQVAPQKDLDKRARYYIYKMMKDGFSHQGEEYGELTAVYVIFILSLDPKGKGLEQYIFTHSAREDTSVGLNDESEITYLNGKGKKGSASQGLEDFYSSMEGKNTTNSEFIRRIKKTVDNYREIEEWSEHVMNTEQIKEMALEEGRREATVLVTGKTVKMLKRMNKNNEQILQELSQDYSDDFSDRELEESLK